MIVTLGSCDGAVRETRSKLAADGVQTDYMRIRAFPFSKYVIKFLAGYSQVFVVEQNRDAQMLSLMKLELTPEHVSRLRSVLHYSGLPIDARSITDGVLLQEGYRVRKADSGSTGLPRDAGSGGK